VGLAIDVIKHGKTKRSEQFSEEKLRASIIAACHSVQTPTGQAEAIADAVTAKVIMWLKDRHEITSNDLRLNAGEHLHAHHPEAAYLYRQYRITI